MFDMLLNPKFYVAMAALLTALRAIAEFLKALAAVTPSKKDDVFAAKFSNFLAKVAKIFGWLGIGNFKDK